MNKIFALIFIIIGLTGISLETKTDKATKTLKELEDIERIATNKTIKIEKEYQELFIQTDIILDSLENIPDTLVIEESEKKGFFKRIIDSISNKSDSLKTD